MSRTDNENRVFQAMNFISRNIDRMPVLEEIADQAACSMYHFHRLFKNITGETVATFSRRIRLEYAANCLLWNPASDITGIALDCGYSSSQNFSKAFSKHFNISPTMFKKQRLGETNRKPGNAESTGGGYDCLREGPSGDVDGVSPEIRVLPGYQLGYIRSFANNLAGGCVPVFRELLRKTHSTPPRLNPDSGLLGLYWDNPAITSPQRCRIDACVVTEDSSEDWNTQRIGGQEYAVFHYDTSLPRLAEAWENSMEWLRRSPYRYDNRTCIQRYYTEAFDPDGDRRVFDICIPLRR